LTFIRSGGPNKNFGLSWKEGGEDGRPRKSVKPSIANSPLRKSQNNKSKEREGGRLWGREGRKGTFARKNSDLRLILQARKRKGSQDCDHVGGAREITATPTTKALMS